MLKDIDKYLIDMTLSILESDLPSEASKLEADKYIKYLLENGTESEKAYALEKLNNSKFKEFLR